MSNIKRRIVKRDTTSQHPLEQLISFDSYGRLVDISMSKSHRFDKPAFYYTPYGCSHSCISRIPFVDLQVGKFADLQV